MKRIGLALLALMFTGIGPVGRHLLTAQTLYSLPNNNAGCPGNCRAVQWTTGSDLWNGGVLPNYSSVTCTGLAGNGTTNDGPAIQACINSQPGTAASPRAVLIPAGTYLVNSTVRLKSYVVLRGAQPEPVSGKYLPTADANATTIILGSGALITTQNFSYTSISGYNGYGALPSPSSLSGTPKKGDTTVTIGSGTVSVGTWMKIFGNDDPTLINVTGTDGTCNWCGDNSGFYVQQQIVQVTGINSGTGGPGSVVAISKPLYYPPYTAAVTTQGQTEPAGAKYNTIGFPTQKAGIENLRIDGSHSDIGANQIVLFQGCLYCWVKSAETFVTGSNSGSAHVELDFSYGNEIRDSYLHDQRSGASGSGYGVYFQFTNGDHKVENNILRHNRHSIVYQGGGSGTAILYNYLDDMYTDDPSYMGSARTSHGAHPFFNLFEGNVMSHLTADDFWGSTSHNVYWRNWFWGDETENWTPSMSVLQSYPTSPNSGFDAVDLYQGQEYYSVVGNVLGLTAIPTGANNSCSITSTAAPHTNWPKATLSLTCATNNCGYEQPSAPGVFTLGGALGSTATSSGTILRYGNYDYLSHGVANWDGATANGSIPNSLYYTSKPAFFGTCRWPVAGYDQSPVSALNPAEATYLGANVQSGTSGTPPAPPTGLTAVVH